MKSPKILNWKSHKSTGDKNNLLENTAKIPTRKWVFWQCLVALVLYIITFISKTVGLDGATSNVMDINLFQYTLLFLKQLGSSLKYKQHISTYSVRISILKLGACFLVFLYIHINRWLENLQKFLTVLCPNLVFCSITSLFIKMSYFCIGFTFLSTHFMTYQDGACL